MAPMIPGSALTSLATWFLIWFYFIEGKGRLFRHLLFSGIICR